MQILFVIPVYTDKIGGRERYLYKISEELSKEYDVEVVTRFDSPVDYFASSNRFLASSKNKTYFNDKIKVNVIGISFFEKIWLLPVYKLHFNLNTQKLAQWMYNKVWVKKITPFIKLADIVEYHGTGLELLSFSVLKTCKMLNKPFLVLPHCHPGNWGDGDIDIELYKSADRVIVKSEYEKQFMMSKGVNEGKIKVIYSAPIITNECDAEWFREKYNIKGNMVLFIGRKTKGKGYNTVIDSMKLIWQDEPETFFVFIGNGESAYPVKDRKVIELPWCDGFEKSSAYAACDIFCMPSYEEAFGIVYAEAWKFSKPVIGGDIPALREIISDENDGLLVKQDSKVLAGAVLKLLKDKALRIKMGMTGKRKVEEIFNWDKVIGDTKNLYNSFN
ncbi:MAG: glycosyltransferase family 4 protein [bacterium]|nr:glycosyltransferase family 4 protein [bacterium]